MINLRFDGANWTKESKQFFWISFEHETRWQVIVSTWTMETKNLIKKGIWCKSVVYMVNNILFSKELECNKLNTPCKSFITKCNEWKTYTYRDQYYKSLIAHVPISFHSHKKVIQARCGWFKRVLWKRYSAFHRLDLNITRKNPSAKIIVHLPKVCRFFPG